MPYKFYKVSDIFTIAKKNNESEYFPRDTVDQSIVNHSEGKSVQMIYIPCWNIKFMSTPYTLKTSKYRHS